jgi:hypothetical protein
MALPAMNPDTSIGRSGRLAALLLPLVVAVGTSSGAPRSAPRKAFKVVAPSSSVRARIAAAGRTYTSLRPSRHEVYRDAILEWTRQQGASAVRDIISLGAVDGVQHFLLVYPNPMGGPDVPYSLARVKESTGPGGAARFEIRADGGSSLAVGPWHAWRRAAKALTGYRLLHKARPLGLSTRHTLVYRHVGSDTLVEVPLFKGQGRISVHRGEPGTFDVRPDADARLMRAAGIRLIR